MAGYDRCFPCAVAKEQVNATPSETALILLGIHRDSPHTLDNMLDTMCVRHRRELERRAANAARASGRATS